MASEIIRLLLVEDSTGDFRLTQEMFAEACATPHCEKLRISLSWVKRITDAQTLLRQQEFDVILLDLSLPDAAGLDAFRALRGIAAETPVILLTGYDDLDAAKEAIGEGAEDYLIKGKIDGALLTRAVVYSIERKRAQQERLELQKKLLTGRQLESLGVMAGGLAHDLNNLLQGILGQTNLALMRSRSDEMLQQRLIQIEQLVGHATELVNNLFACAGKVKFSASGVDLSELVRETVTLLSPTLPRGVRLETYFTSELPRIEADASQIRQVVMNLITNAAEALPQGKGKIRIRTVLEHSHSDKTKSAEESLPEVPHVVLEVWDTGKGMDAATRQRIFEPFFTTKVAGRGLGLASVLGIVRGYQGSISVQSRPRQGTIFRVFFPSAVSAANAVAA